MFGGSNLVTNGTFWIKRCFEESITQFRGIQKIGSKWLFDPLFEAMITKVTGNIHDEQEVSMWRPCRRSGRKRKRKRVKSHCQCGAIFLTFRAPTRLLELVSSEGETSLFGVDWLLVPVDKGTFLVSFMPGMEGERPEEVDACCGLPLAAKFNTGGPSFKTGGLRLVVVSSRTN